MKPIKTKGWLTRDALQTMLWTKSEPTLDGDFFCSYYPGTPIDDDPSLLVRSIRSVEITIEEIE